MLSKIDLKVQIDAKSGQLKNESKSEIFSAPGDVQESANGTNINAFDVRLIVPFRMHLIIHLHLHLKVNFKIYIKVHKKVHLRSQSAITCTKLTIETLEQGVKYVQS